MSRDNIRDLVISVCVDRNRLTEVVDLISKEIGDAYDKGFNQGKYDPDFDNAEWKCRKCGEIVQDENVTYAERHEGCGGICD